MAFAPAPQLHCFLPSRPLAVSTFTPRPYFAAPTSKSCRPAFNPMQTRRVRCVVVSKHDVFMPALSSTMTEGRIVQWLKQPGDHVTAGEPIMVVESDKADMDVEAFETGYLAGVSVEEGESCAVGDVVAFIVENKDDVDKVSAAAPSAPAAVAEPSTPSAPPASTPAAASAPVDKPDMFDVFMPALSSTMSEGKVVDWLKAEGDPVSSGDMLMVVESDKADMDVESFESGFLAHIVVEAGESCPVGEPVAYLAMTEADIPAVKAWATSQSSSTSAAPAAQVAAPPSANSVPPPAAPVAAPAAAVVNEGRIIASPLAKATAKKDGVDLKYVKGTGPNGRIVERDVLAAKANGVARDVPSQAPAYTSPSGKIIATPDAKKVAKKEKIDLATVKGTGNFGRVTAEDVLRAAGKAPVEAKAATPAAAPTKTSAASAAAAAATSKEAASLPSGAVAMNGMQQAVVKNMNASLTVPVFRLTYKIKTTALDALYAKVKPNGVTMSALLAKAVGLTLAKHPILNAAYGDNSIVYREDINVAMAVALPDGGLITPTLKNADRTDLHSLSRNWKDLVARSREKKLSPDEYNSGTFFISNLGMFGVEQFDAILPPGAPGILAIGASKPVVSMQESGLIGVQKEMSVTLTADHRHIYGADGALFLKDLASLIEGDVTELLL